MMIVVVQGVPSERRLDFVDSDFECSDSAWADGNLAEAAGQLGKMVEHRNQSQPNPGLSSLGTPFSYRMLSISFYRGF